MALRDYEAFMRERLQIWDPNADVSPGSPLDIELIQPMLGRIGNDPFSTNLPLFIRDRLAQEWPNMYIDEGGALVDMLVKGTELIFDPVVRETNRIALSQSLKDPSLLTTDDADALAANTFSNRKRGEYAMGQVRVRFGSPRQLNVSPTDYFISKSGLLFYATSKQTISPQEMLLNQEGSEYYFDVNTIAEAPGEVYNIQPGSIARAPTLQGASSVTNKVKFSGGLTSEGAPEFIARSDQGLSHRSMGVLRGIIHKLTEEFGNITRINVVGFNDPEMQRDIVKGGGLGPIIASGEHALSFPDGLSGSTTRRIRVTDPVDFTLLIGSPNLEVKDYVLTAYGAFATGLASIQDLDITKVLDGHTVEVEQSLFGTGLTDVPWGLRKRSITLTDIPGGIVFPDSANGQVSIVDNEIHVGGLTDIYIKSSGFEEGALVLDAVTDDQPVDEGTQAFIPNTAGAGQRTVVLQKYTNAGPPQTGAQYYTRDTDPVYRLIRDAINYGWVFHITEPSSVAGFYRITAVEHVTDALDIHFGRIRLTIDADAGSGSGVQVNDIVWKIQDDLDVDLVEPKETKLSGSDLQTGVGSDLVSTASGHNFDALGVAVDDIVRIIDGPDAGDYEVVSIPAPYTSLQISANLSATKTGLKYTIFRPNAAGGMSMPLIRVTTVDVLDSDQQPTGSTIPYGAPVYAATKAFSNAARGVKLDLQDGALGIVGRAFPTSLSPAPNLDNTGVEGKALHIRWMVRGTLDKDPLVQYIDVAMPALGPVSLAEVVEAINLQVAAVVGFAPAYIVGNNRLGIAPIAPYTEVDSSVSGPLPSCYKDLFGTGIRWAEPLTSRDVRSDEFLTRYYPNFGWLDPRLNIDKETDVVEVLTGTQVGGYSIMRDAWILTQPAVPESGLLIDTDLNPEVGRRVRVGARSIGYGRFYFLEPVTIEFNQGTECTVYLADGTELTFRPDPLIDAIRIPAPPSSIEPKDGEVTAYTATDGTFSSVSAEFVSMGVQSGDILRIARMDVPVSSALADPVVGIADKTLIFSVDGSADVEITLLETSAPGDVGRAELAEQINTALGVQAVIIDYANRLALSGDIPVTLRFDDDTTASAIYFITGMQAIVTQDITNTSDMFGDYLILRVDDEQTLRFRTIDDTPGLVTTTQFQHFSVVRPGAQRITSTQMQANEGPAGLYYADVELASNGTSDLYNVDAGLEMLVEGFYTYGYYLNTNNEVLTFSEAEEPVLTLPPVYFPVGTSDDLRNAVRIIFQNLQVNYETQSLIRDAQAYTMSDMERDVCQNPLVKHLIPHYVRFNLTYEGGSKASVLRPDMEALIRNTYPNQPLKATELQYLASKRGATAVDGPLDLIAVVHQIDRKVWLDWSQNSISTGRLAAFIPDVLNITRRSA